MSDERKISQDDLPALQRVLNVADAMEIPIVLVGAGARLLVMDWPFVLPSKRTTADWDFALEVTDWKTFERFRDALRHPHAEQGTSEHRVVIGATPIDLVPFGGVEHPNGEICWPRGKERMTVRGLSEALVFASERASAVPVAPLPLLAALKVIAFAERGQETDKDLRDLYFILTNYARCGNEDRIFDEFTDELGAGLPYDQAGPLLLGRDLARHAKPETLAYVRNELDRLPERLDLYANALLGRCLDEDQRERDLADLHALFAALRRGVGG